MNWENFFFWASLVLGLGYLGVRWKRPQWATRLLDLPLLPALLLAPFALTLGVILAAVGPAIWLGVLALLGHPSPDLGYAWRVIPLAMAIYFHVAIRFFLLPTVGLFLLYRPLATRWRWFSGSSGVVLVAMAVSLSNDFIGQRNGIPSQGGAAWLLLGGFLAALWCLPLTRPKSSPSVPSS